jgi:hypothetical protein
MRRPHASRLCCLAVAAIVMAPGRGASPGGVVSASNSTCDWVPACGSEVNVRPSGQGCVNPALGNVSYCTVCNYIFNSPPCDNTAENVYKNRVALYAGTPHFNHICGGHRGGNADRDDPWNDPEIECGPICAASKRPAFKSITLMDMCYRYSAKSCCYAIQDNEIAEAYFTLLEAGDRCQDELLYPKLKLRDAFCATCDPDQGSYLVEGKLNMYVCPCGECGDLSVCCCRRGSVGGTAPIPGVLERNYSEAVG